jgi:hypothetical protein
MSETVESVADEIVEAAEDVTNDVDNTAESGQTNAVDDDVVVTIGEEAPPQD